MSTAFSLPVDFLCAPAPNIKISKVDFTQTKLPEYAPLYAVVLDDVFTASECAQLVAAVESRTGGTWEAAMVGREKQELMLDVRNCGRFIWDDRQLAEKILDRVKLSVPEIEVLANNSMVTGKGPMKRKEIWRMTRLNERMRFLKYGPMQYFMSHCDGAYETPDKSERSYFTLHLYLNESDPSGPYGKLVGGATGFHSMDMQREYKVHPKVGRVLIFQQRGLLHSGEEVLSVNGVLPGPLNDTPELARHWTKPAWTRKTLLPVLALMLVSFIYILHSFYAPLKQKTFPLSPTEVRPLTEHPVHRLAASADVEFADLKKRQSNSLAEAADNTRGDTKWRLRRTLTSGMPLR
ncbi:hypothetical protein MMC13_000547 [Lambiella insularis]|nr:hypothetical protein [Lambiella insularis]